MSKAGLEKIVNAMADESFRNRVREDPDAALTEYDLTPEEKAAIKSGGAAKLRELGVDEWMSVLGDLPGDPPSTPKTKLPPP